jgi:hypothetical protein
MKTIKALVLLALFLILIAPAHAEVTLGVYVPPGWELQDSYEEPDWGYWAYGTVEGTSVIFIMYDFAIPAELVGHEDDPDALADYAYNNAWFTPDYVDNEILDGQMAGYAEEDTDDGYYRYIVYVKEGVFVSIDGDIYQDDHNAATALLDSVTLSSTEPTPEPTPSPTATPSPTLTPTPTASPTPTPAPSPTAPPRSEKHAPLSPPTLVATLNPGESVTELKTYTTAEGTPITRVDVLFCFDLTGSMGEELSTMQTESQNIMNSLRAQVPDSAFGVASFMDYSGSYSYGGYTNTYGSAEDYPWRLNRAVTTNTNAVEDTINGLTLGNGEDYPEAYSRALYETYADSSVGWRTGAKKIVILFGDDVPHDPAYATGIDPGRDGKTGTADDLYFTEVVAGLKAHGITVLALHSGTDARPWQYMTEQTGGLYYELSHTEATKIPQTIAEMVEAEVATIGELTLRAASGYVHWVSIAPRSYADVGSGETKSFQVTVRVPEGTTGGTYQFTIELIGDGTVLGTQEVSIAVPVTEKPTPGTLPTPHPTAPSPSLQPIPEIGRLRPAKLTATLQPGESVREVKTYTTAEGTPITRVDVLFCFDLTGSMTEELSTMKTESKNIMNRLRELAPDSAFGVASFMDYPGSYAYDEYHDTYGAAKDYPWRVDRGVTLDADRVQAAINNLTLGNGEDHPESYSRALYEAYADPAVGWRPGAKRIIVIFGDDIPHDPAYETGIDPGRDGKTGTADDLFFTEVVAGLKAHGITVLALHSGADERPWRYMTEETGGIYYKLTHAEAAEIPEAVAEMVEAEVATVGELTLRAGNGYEAWVTVTPPRYTDVGGGELRTFEVTVRVPEGTKGGTYSFPIELLGDGTALSTQLVTITVLPGAEPESAGLSHLEMVRVSIRENGDTLMSFTFRQTPRREAEWLANRFEIATSLKTALEQNVQKEVIILKISSRENAFLIPALVQPAASTYTMPAIDLDAFERDLQVAIAEGTAGAVESIGPLVPTTAMIAFPDAYTETFENTTIIPETSHTIAGAVEPWLTITDPPSGAVLENATLIRVRASEEITHVSLVIQGSTWEERLEDGTPPFAFEWNLSDPDLPGGSYRVEARGAVGKEELEAANHSILVDVKKPAVPLATLIAVLTAGVLASAAAVRTALSSRRISATRRGRGISELDFSFHRSILAEQFRTSLMGDLFRSVLGVVALSLAYTLQCTLPMKTLSFTLPISIPVFGDALSILVPTSGELDPNVWLVFFIIIALVGTIILVREVVQYLMAWGLNAETGAIIDRMGTILVLGSGFFGNPFGYPLRTVIWKDEPPRVKGVICLGNILGLFSLLAFFYYLSFVWLPDAWWVVWVGGVGLPAVAMTLVYSTIPFVGEEGTVIYEWNKPFSIALFLAAGFMYLSFILNWLDPLSLQFQLGLISLGGLGFLTAGIVIYKFLRWINLF